MAMNRIHVFSAACLLSIAFLVGCNKPTEEDCKKAIENVQKILGTEHLQTDIPGEIRRCRGGSSKTKVACAMAATSLEGLRACDFMKGSGKKSEGSSEKSEGSSEKSEGSAK
jgi:hypothetical protein